MNASPGCGGSLRGDRDDSGGVGDGECRQTPEAAYGEAGGGGDQPSATPAWDEVAEAGFEAGESFAEMVVRAFLDGSVLPRNRAARELVVHCRDLVSGARRPRSGMDEIFVAPWDSLDSEGDVGGGR